MGSRRDSPPARRDDGSVERTRRTRPSELVEVFRPHPEMGRFIRRHPVLMVTWASLGAAIFYTHLVTFFALLVP